MPSQEHNPIIQSSFAPQPETKDITPHLLQNNSENNTVVFKNLPEKMDLLKENLLLTVRTEKQQCVNY